MPYWSDRRPSSASANMAETDRDDTSTGKDCWSTNPAASETIPGFSRAVCIRLLIEGALVRWAALLRVIRGAIVRVGWFEAGSPSGSVGDSSGQRGCVKLGSHAILGPREGRQGRG